MENSIFTKFRLLSFGFAFALNGAQAATGTAHTLAPDHFSHLSYTTPTNWKPSHVGNWLILSAPDLPAGQIAQIGLSPGGETTRSLADEFSAFVAASQGSYTTVQTQPAKNSSDTQGLPSFQQTVLLQNSAGVKLLRFYIGKKNGSRFEAISVTVSPEAVNQIVPVLKSFFTSLKYDGAPATQGAQDTGAGKPGGNETAVQPGAAALPVTAPTAGPIKISKHDKVIGPLAIVVGHDGTIHVAFTEQLSEGIENAVYYRSSSDGGHTWTEAKNLSEVMPTYMVGRVQIAVDGSDRVYVVWRVAGQPNNQTTPDNSATTSDNVVYRVLSGGAWNGTALNVNPPADRTNYEIGATSFYVGSDPSGKVHVAWVQSTDILHPELMFNKTMHQFGMGNGDVVQADLDGASHSAPREIFMPKVTDDGTYKACEGLDLINGYFDSNGQAHFCGLVTGRKEANGVNRIEIFENGTEKPGITLPGPAYSLTHVPPTLLFDTKGRHHIVALFPAGEHHAIRDYLIGSDAEPVTIRAATDSGSVDGFQACQSPGGQMIALMEMSDFGIRRPGDLFVSTSAGTSWSTPMKITDNASKATSTNAVTGIRSSVNTISSWFPGRAAATFDKQGHLVLIHERRESSSFGVNARGVTLAGGDSTTPRLYFMRF